MKQNAYLIPFFCLFLASTTAAQTPDSTKFIKKPSRIVMVTTGGKVQYPLFDMSKRFGYNGQPSLDITVKNQKNWIFGVNGGIMFGNVVKDSTLRNVAVSETFVIDENGRLSNIVLTQRGWNVFATAGKLFATNPKNINSGIVTQFGMGILQHKIRVENSSNFAPPIEEEYKKGYDKLTNGVAFNQFLGYMYLSKNKRVNYYVGLDLTEAITKNRRSVNFDTRMPDTAARFDVLVGIKAGWILPLYKRREQDFLYFE